MANCQVGAFLGYASPKKGHAGIDRALYVPQAWLDEPTRSRRAGIPAGVAHSTKPQLAGALLERALDGGVLAAWVVADEVYGSDGTLRRVLEARGQAYVLAVRGSEKPSTWPPYGPPAQVAVSEVAATVPHEGWTRLSCGEGSQGPRHYDWAYRPLRSALRDGWVHALLVRRPSTRPAEVTSYLVYAPSDVALAQVVRAVGTRWTIEEIFKLAKGQVGLDQYEVRSWRGWHRHMTLALLALAALTVGAAKGGSRVSPPHPAHRSRTPPPARPSRLGHHHPSAGPGRCLVTLATAPPKDGSSLPPPSPPKTPKGTAILRACANRGAIVRTTRD